MELGRECLDIWGYKRVDELIWVKTNQLQRLIRTGRTGHWLNHSKEHCLVGVKGNPNINRCIDCDVLVAEVGLCCMLMLPARVWASAMALVCQMRLPAVHAWYFEGRLWLLLVTRHLNTFAVLTGIPDQEIAWGKGERIEEGLRPCMKVPVMVMSAGQGDVQEARRDVLTAGAAEPGDKEAGDLCPRAQPAAGLGGPGQSAQWHKDHGA